MMEYDRIIELLRQQGERLTIPRRLVIEALTSHESHMTIKDVGTYIRETHTSQALSEPTIYRILQRLKEMEVISQTDIAESGIVYQVIGSARHHHLVCLTCGQTIDVDDHLFDDLRAVLSQKYQFQARIDHMAIYGQCANCTPPPAHNAASDITAAI